MWRCEYENVQLTDYGARDWLLDKLKQGRRVRRRINERELVYRRGSRSDHLVLEGRASEMRNAFSIFGTAVYVRCHTEEGVAESRCVRNASGRVCRLLTSESTRHGEPLFFSHALLVSSPTGEPIREE